MMNSKAWRTKHKSKNLFFYSLYSINRIEYYKGPTEESKPSMFKTPIWKEEIQVLKSEKSLKKAKLTSTEKEGTKQGMKQGTLTAFIKK